MNQAAETAVKERTCASCAPLFQFHGGGMLLLILLFSTLLDFYFFTGYFASDDQTYYDAARHFLETGQYPDLSTGAVRLTLVGWIMLVIQCCGPSIQFVAASFILFHQLLNALTFLMVRGYADRRAGLLAAYLIAVFPLFVTYSSMILPDVPQTCCYVLAVLCSMRWQAWRDTRPILAWLAFFASGFCVGLGYMSKEAALVLLPFFFVAWLTTFKRTRVWFSLIQGASFAVGFFSILAIEYLTLTYLAGEPVVRIARNTREVSQVVQTAVAKYGFEPLERLEWVNRRLDEDVCPHYMKILCILAMVALPFLKPRRWTLWLLPIWIFAYQVWGSMNLRRYVPPTIQARYFAVIAPFVLAALAILAVWFYDRVKALPVGTTGRRCLRTIAIAAVVVAPLLGLAGPDHQAGKAYKSDIIGNASNAVHWAQQFDPERKLLLCSTLAEHLRLMNVADEHPYLVGRDMRDEEFGALLRGGDFFYVALDPERLYGERQWIRNSPIDETLRSIVGLYVNPLRTTRTADNLVYRSVLGPGRARIPWGNTCYDIETCIINSLTQPISRTAAFVSNGGRWPWKAGTEPDPASRTVLVYEVKARLAETPPATTAITERLAFDLMTTFQDVRENADQQIFEKWAVSNDAEEHRFERGADGWTLLTNISSSKNIWFGPRKNTISMHAFPLQQGKRYKLVVDVRIEGGLKVEFLSMIYDRDVASDQRTTVARVWLTDGVNVMGLCADDDGACFWPYFKLFGPGGFEIRDLKIYEVD